MPEQQTSATVAITRAHSYEASDLQPAIQKALALIGGLESVVPPGAKVFVKINHLPPPSPPERGIVTHPAFTEAVLHLLKDAGAEITVGDDIDEGGEDGFAVSGYRQMCQRLGVRLVNLRQTGFVPVKCDGDCLNEVYVARELAAADVIIDLPKLKTHSLCTLTGGVKNLYGVTPVGLRRRYHGDFLDVADFSRMIVDIYAAARPHLTIMDGVMAMEGEGPGSGQVRRLGVVLASRDAVALDAVAGKIIGLEPQRVLTTRNAGERGLGVSDLGRIEVVGESITSVAVPDFKLPAAAAIFATRHAPRWLGRLAVSQVTPRPYVRRMNCTACAACVNACPTGAITIPEDKATINYGLCIRCMCCHEVCRFNAIIPRRPPLGRAVYGVVGVARRVVRR